MPVRVMIAIVLLPALLAGCRTPGPSDRAVLRMVSDVRHEASELPDSPQKATVVAQLEAVERSLGGEPIEGADRLVTSAEWIDTFGPQACDVSYFTEFADFNGDGSPNGLSAIITLTDRFGDPVKALGRFRIETFDYLPRSVEHRGDQLSNWIVNVFSAADVERYYDNITRGYRFPLKFAGPVPAGRVVVQVTYYVPDGSGRKLFGQRAIKPEAVAGR